MVRHAFRHHSCNSCHGKSIGPIFRLCQEINILSPEFGIHKQVFQVRHKRYIAQGATCLFMLADVVKFRRRYCFRQKIPPSHYVRPQPKIWYSEFHHKIINQQQRRKPNEILHQTTQILLRNRPAREKNVSLHP